MSKSLKSNKILIPQIVNIYHIVSKNKLSHFMCTHKAQKNRFEFGLFPQLKWPIWAQNHILDQIDQNSFKGIDFLF